jgi:hypothetical protein
LCTVDADALRSWCTAFTFLNHRTPTKLSSACQDTFFFFSFRAAGSGDGTRRAAADARSLAVLIAGPASSNGLRPALPPPSTVTPVLSPPSAANGLALTLLTLFCACVASLTVPAGLSGAEAVSLACFGEPLPDAASAALPRVVASTAIVLMVTGCSSSASDAQTHGTAIEDSGCKRSCATALAGTIRPA